MVFPLLLLGIFDAVNHSAMASGKCGVHKPKQEETLLTKLCKRVEVKAEGEHERRVSLAPQYRGRPRSGQLLGTAQCEGLKGVPGLEG